jgi:band 4.1-like protein 1/2/3
LGKNAKTQQLEEKTIATTTTHDAKGQEQRVVTLTQEVKITSGDQVLYGRELLIENI